MDRNNTIKKFIVENFLFGDSDKLTDETDLFRESIIDSTGILELIAFIETSYNINIMDTEILQENFCSIKSIHNFLRSKKVESTDKICAE